MVTGFTPVAPDMGEALTASFESAPDTHSGSTGPFEMRVRFSDAVSLDGEELMAVLAVMDGAATGAALVDGHDDLWAVQVAPASGVDVVLNRQEQQLIASISKSMAMMCVPEKKQNGSCT